MRSCTARRSLRRFRGPASCTGSTRTRADTELVRQLQARTVKRDYLALVHGVVKLDGEVSAPVGRDPRHRTRMAVVPTGRPALTRFKVTKRFARVTLKRVK